MSEANLRTNIGSNSQAWSNSNRGDYGNETPVSPVSRGSRSGGPSAASKSTEPIVVASQGTVESGENTGWLKNFIVSTLKEVGTTVMDIGSTMGHLLSGNGVMGAAEQTQVDRYMPGNPVNEAMVSMNRQLQYGIKDDVAKSRPTDSQCLAFLDSVA